MENIKISIVIPAYNREELIQDAIKSCINQTKKIDDIVIIDNHSTDNTFLIAKKYALLHKNIRVFRNKKNIGMVNNWNRGVKLAKGNYISILHSDDLIPENWCHIVKFFIEKNLTKNIGLYFGILSCCKIRKNKIKITSKIKPFAKDKFLPKQKSLEKLWSNFYGNPNASAAIIYQGRIFQKIGFFDPANKTEADQEFHIRTLSRFNSFFIAKNLVFYRRHSYQAFDKTKRRETDLDSANRLIRSISIQKRNLCDINLIKYSYCGILFYIIKFFLKCRYREMTLVLKKIDGIFNLKTISAFPRFLVMLFQRRFFSKYSN